MGIDFQPDQFTTVFWDVFGEQGHPVRATVTEIGPLLLSRMLDLNDVQEGVLNVAFRVADENGLTLIDMKDLRATAGCDRARRRQKGTGSPRWSMNSPTSERPRRASVTSARRRSEPLSASFWCWKTSGASKFFGEPALALKDFMKTDSDGRGVINILAADQLMQSPKLYATFLLWMLSGAVRRAAGSGRPAKPKLVFFFDEAHLLFDDAPEALMDKIEQVVRLIRSKGVGVYFVTQIRSTCRTRCWRSLGGRVQHALRAFTPRDQKAVKAAAQTFRPNPKLDTARVIMELGKGEALVSFLEGGGTPTMVERVMIRPPTARIGPVDARRSARRSSTRVRSRANTTRLSTPKSAYEMLQKRVAGTAAPADGQDGGGGGVLGQIGSIVGTIFGTNVKRGKMSTGQVIARDVTRSVTNKVIGGVAADLGKAVGGSLGGSIGRSLVRGALGSLLRR